MNTYLDSVLKIFSTTLLGKVLGFLKIVLLIRLYGVSPLTDALIIVISIYWFWSSVVVYSLFSITLIPRLSSACSQKRQIFIALKTLYSVNTLALFVLFLLLFFTETLLYIFAPIEEARFINDSKVLLILMSPMLFLIPATEIFTILNQYNDRMIVASVNLAVWNSLQIFALLICFYSMTDFTYLAYVFALFTVIGYVITSVIQLKYANFFSYFHVLSLARISLTNAKALIGRNWKFFTSVIMININLYIDNFFISGLSSGSLSKYNIIIKVPDVIQSLLVSSLVVVFFNIIVKNKEKARPLFGRFTLYFSFIFLVGLLLTNYFGVQILYLIYGSDAFQGMQAVEIVKILLIIVANVFFMISIALLLKIFIVHDQPNFVVVASSAHVIVNVIANYFLIDSYGLLGIAMATLIVNYLFYLMLLTRGLAINHAVSAALLILPLLLFRIIF